MGPAAAEGSKVGRVSDAQSLLFQQMARLCGAQCFKRAPAAAMFDLGVVVVFRNPECGNVSWLRGLMLDARGWFAAAGGCAVCSTTDNSDGLVFGRAYEWRC